MVRTHHLVAGPPVARLPTEFATTFVDALPQARLRTGHAWHAAAVVTVGMTAGVATGLHARRAHVHTALLADIAQ